MEMSWELSLDPIAHISPSNLPLRIPLTPEHPEVVGFQTKPTGGPSWIPIESHDFRPQNTH